MSDKNDHHILRGVPLNSDFTKHLDKTLSKYLVDVLLTRDGNQILMVNNRIIFCTLNNNNCGTHKCKFRKT